MSLGPHHLEWHPPALPDEVEDESEGDDDERGQRQGPAQGHTPIVRREEILNEHNAKETNQT